MIQRIQSLFLLLSALSYGLIFLFPFSTAEAGSEGAYIDGDFDVFDHSFLLALNILCMAYVLIDIFLFKNRNLQKSMVTISFIVGFAYFSLATFMTIQSKFGSISIGLIILLLPCIFQYLAKRFIQNDINIVKSMDRIR
jgi:hypothetical protein